MKSGILKVNELREKMRECHKLNRDLQRKSLYDSLRLDVKEIKGFLTEIDNLNEQDVTNLFTSIKSKKRANLDDMVKLSHAFLQDENNIILFINTSGVLDFVVKELTGQTYETQIRACETLCNITLGNHICCEKVASSAGIYLMIFLLNSHNTLKQIILWTVTNIASTDGKGLQILISQGLIPKLIMIIDTSDDPEILDDTYMLLDIILTKNALSYADITALRKFRAPINNTNYIRFLFHLLFCEPFEEIQDTEQYIKLCVKNFIEVNDINCQDNISRILFSIRISSNIIAKNSSSFYVLLNICQSFNVSLVEILNKIFNWKHEVIKKETIWLIANLVACEKSEPGTTMHIQNLINNLKLKK